MLRLAPVAATKEATETRDPAVEKLTDGEGERGERGQYPALGIEAVERIVRLAGEGLRFTKPLQELILSSLR